MTTREDWNKQVIAEFHANGGKVGGPFEGATMILLTTTGAKSGEKRISPLVTIPDGDRFLIVASKGGAPTNPDWYYNLKANPIVTAEVGTEKFEARAKILDREERDSVFAEIVKQAPNFGEYQKNTTRIIPVVAIERIAN